MKITLELTSNMAMKIEVDEGMTWPIVLGLLHEAILNVQNRYSLSCGESITKEKATAKRKAKAEAQP